MKDLGEILKRTSLFSSLSKKEIDAVLAASELMTLTRKENLFKAGLPKDSIYLVISGGVKLEKVRRDANFIMAIYKPGDIVGEDALASNGTWDLQAVPMDNATVMKIHSPSLIRLIETNVRFAKDCLDLIATRNREFQEKLESLVFMEVQSRLAQALLYLARSFGHRDKLGTLISIRITHQELADYIGASRETVSLALGQMRKNKLIHMNVRKFIISDTKALHKLTV